MKVVVLQFPGTNCEYDTKYAFEKYDKDFVKRCSEYESNVIIA